MKLAIMQPYFFPYIGYFQLINAVQAEATQKSEAEQEQM
jgi:hypothetical protein